MNHFKFLQRIVVVALLVVTGMLNKVSAQTCPTSNEVTITVLPDLSISTNLVNITECIGGTGTLLVATTGGSGGTLTYAWEQSSNNSTWSPATGSTNAATYEPPSGTAGVMYYRVVITDPGTGCDARTSLASTVTITPDLNITTNLANITECIGGSEVLTVVTSGGTGGALTYNWEQSTDNTTWGPATGASSTSNTYQPSASTAGTMYYRVSVGDAASGCGSAPSTAATVVVTPDLSITTNLANITECLGGSGTLTVATTGGTGGALSYTWEQSTDNTTWGPATAASSTSPTYTPSSSTVGVMYYRVSVGDAASGCGAAPSVAATVTITPDLSITTNLANITECIGGSNTLTVATTGGTGGALTYTWEQSSDNTTWAPATGASSTSPTYTPDASTAGTMYYRVSVGDAASGCGAAPSVAATVVVTPDLSITTNLANITECIGGSNTLTVATTGGTGGALTYTWEQSTNNTTWAPATGASSTSPTYTPDASTAGTMYYRVSVGDAASGCGAAPSVAATVVVTPDLAITTDLANITECVGGDRTLTVATSGGTGGALTYTWEQSSDNTTWGPATGASATSSTYQPASSTAGVMYYRVSVGDASSGCGASPSAVATVTVTPDLSITTNLANITECVGGSGVLTVATTGGTGGALTYTWEQSADNTTWGPATGASSTSPTYTPSASTAGTMYYRVSVGDAASGCASAPSVAATVVVTPDLSITTNLANITECIGGSGVLTVATTGGTGGALTYTWEQSADNTTWAPATGASSTSPTYTPDASTAGTMYYRVSVGDAASGCGSAPSVAATVVVTPDLSITTNLANITECIGGSNTLTVATTGGTGGALSYTWEQSTNNTTWAPATGASSTSPTYTPDASTAGTMYYRVSVGDAASGCGAAPSVVATVIVTPDLTITTDLANITECIGGSNTLTVVTTGGTGGALTYTWEQSSNNTTWAPATGASSTSPTYTPDASTAGTMYYRVSVGDAASGCGAAPSVVATVVVSPDLNISTNLANITECVGGNRTLTVATTGGTGGALTYTWEQSTDNTTWAPATGASASSSTYQPASSAAGVMYYRVSVGDASSGCGAAPSVAATVTVTPDLSIAVNLTDITECVSGTLPLSITTTGGSGSALTYTWEQSDDRTTWIPAPGASSSSNTYVPPSTTSGVKYYRVSVADATTGCDAVPSVEATVTIVPKPTITATALTTVICEGGGVALSATPLNGTGTCIIQWQTSTDAGATFNDIPGATGPTYNTPALPTGQTKYKARISCDGNGCCN